MKKHYDLLVFDFNGTIVDDVERCLDLLNQMLVARHHPIVSKDQYLEIFTFPIIEYYKKAGFAFKPEGEDDFTALAKWFTKQYVDRFSSLSLYSDVLDVLSYFKNKKRLVLLSATKKDLLIDECKTLGICSYFSDILGIKDIYAHSKSEVAKKYFLDNNISRNSALFIGDTLHDVEVAKEVGADSLLIYRGHQSKERLIKGGAEFLLPDLASLLLLDI